MRYLKYVRVDERTDVRTDRTDAAHEDYLKLKADAEAGVEGAARKARIARLKTKGQGYKDEIARGAVPDSKISRKKALTKARKFRNLAARIESPPQREDAGVIPLTLPMIAETNKKLRDKRDRAALTKIYSKNWTGALPSPPPQEPMPPGAPPKKGKDGPAATYLRSRRDSRQSGRSKARQIAIARSQGNPTGAPGTQPSVTGQLQAEPRKKIKAGTWKGNRYPHDLGRTVPKEEADKWEREDRS